MNDKQTHFVQEYLVDGNAAAAARRAGYSIRCAKAIGSRLLTNVDIQAAIRAGQQADATRLQIDRHRVIEEIKSAIDMAKEQGNVTAQVAGWREIAKICGYYAPERKQVELSGPARATVAALEAMTDEELMAIVAGTRPA